MKCLEGLCRGALAGAPLALLLLVQPLAAQDLTHPRAMQLPEPAFQRPDPDAMQRVLDNGLVTYVAEDRRAPLLSVTAYVGVGRGHAEAGDAEALAAALRRGPSSLPGNAFREALDAMNADYSVSLGHEEMQLHLDVPAEDASAALSLLADVIRAPAFESPATGQAAGATAGATAGGIDYASSLQGAVDLFENALYAGHAFQRHEGAQGSAAGAEQLHTAFFLAGNMTLAVAGDLSAADAYGEVREAFGRIAEGTVDHGAGFSPLASREARSLLLSEASRDQGWVVIGHELPPVPVADEAALHVMDYVLGAYHLDSRLYRSSRELRGLTNDNSSFLEPGVRGPGSYTFRTYGRPEAVRLLVDVTLRQLELIRDTEVSETELFVAKGALVDGIYAERYATGLDAANAYAQEWLRKGSHENSASYPARIAAVTVEDVQAAAQKYIHPERVIIAVVGPLGRIGDAPAMEGEPQLDVFLAQ